MSKRGVRYKTYRQFCMVVERVLMFYSGLMILVNWVVGLLLILASIVTHWLEYEFEYKFHEVLEEDY